MQCESEYGHTIYVILIGEELLSKVSVLSSIPAKDKFAPGYYHRYS